eukprot:354840-Pelagomonas_calceolata.AAC.4
MTGADVHGRSYSMRLKHPKHFECLLCWYCEGESGMCLFQGVTSFDAFFKSLTKQLAAPVDMQVQGWL